MGRCATISAHVPTVDQSCALPPEESTAVAERVAYEVAHEVVGESAVTGTGVKPGRTERRRVMALARARDIDAVLVTELSRRGRSTADQLQPLLELERWKVSVIAGSGPTFDLGSQHAGRSP